MSLALRKSLAANAQQKRVMIDQYNHLNSVFREGSAKDFSDLLKTFGTNAARTPAEAYREFDLTSKIDMVPAGEYATLTRLMQKSRSVNIGKEVFEYRQTSDMDQGQSSMSGQVGVDLDKVAEKYAGTVVPIHDKGFGRRWRALEAMRSDGYDALVDDAREARRALMGTLNSYLWEGNENLALKGSKWLGIKDDPSVAKATITGDLSASTTGADAIRSEVSRLRDILYITNNCTNPLRLGVSREILSNWERPFTTADGTFGTIQQYIGQLRGIAEIYEDSELVGNELTMYWDDQQGFHPVVGMGMSSYAVPRTMPNSDHAFIMMTAVGFLAKTDYEGRKCALYAS